MDPKVGTTFLGAISDHFLKLLIIKISSISEYDPGRGPEKFQTLPVFVLPFSKAQN